MIEPERYERAREKFVAIGGSEPEGFTFHKKNRPLHWVRRRLDRALYAADGGKASDAHDAMLRSQWFDFRSFVEGKDEAMVAFGREAVSAGVLRLPFDDCVFVAPRSYLNEDFVEVVHLIQQEKRIAVLAIGFVYLSDVAFVLASHSAFGLLDSDIFFLLAAMSSRAAHVERVSMYEGPVPAASDKDVYRRVTIRASAVTAGASLGGTHASPRLHWRRGHVRNLDGRTTWVRPTLVGDGEHGTVFHDYEVA